METTTKKNTNKNKAIIIGLLLLILLLITALIFFIGQKPESEFENNVDKVTEMSIEDRQAAVNQIVEDGMINIQYSSGAVFNGDVSESFNVKNIENNHYPIVFEIQDENGRTIYKSKKIERGYEINSIKLQKSLPKGTHDCRIIIGYAEEGNVSSAFPITIEVK